MTMDEDPDFNNKACWKKSHLGLWDYAISPAHWEYSRAECAASCNRSYLNCKSVTYVETSGECALFSREDSQKIPDDHNDREKFLFATKQCFFDGGYHTGLSKGGIVGIAVAAGLLGLIMLFWLCGKCCKGSHVRHVQNGQSLSNTGSGARHVYNGEIQTYSNTQTRSQVQLQHNVQQSVPNDSTPNISTDISDCENHRNRNEQISEDRATVTNTETVGLESRPHCPPAGYRETTHRAANGPAPPTYTNATAEDLPSYQEVMKSTAVFFPDKR